jgi:hypothetical protein
MIPQSLIFPENDLRCAAQWKTLSVHLFDELCAARSAKPPSSPATLWAEWTKWVTFNPVSAPNIVEKEIVQDWLHAYEASVTSGSAGLSTYAASTAGLFDDKVTKARVPIVVAQDGKAHVLQLEITTAPAGAGHHWLHPAFEHRRADVCAGSGRFAEALASVWTAARGTSPLNIFWQLRSADGGPLPLMKLDGPSASAAAYRAFWHLAEGKVIDPDVYVLADGTSADASIKFVGHLRDKIQAIKSLHASPGQSVPTLVAANTVCADDQAVLDAAKTWAVVHQVSTCTELTAIRSCESAAAISYLEILIERWNPVIGLSTERQVRLADIYVEPSVLDNSTATIPYTTVQARSQPKARRIGWNKVWQNSKQMNPIVLTGMPALGKTITLQWTARALAQATLGRLQNRESLLKEVELPIEVAFYDWLKSNQQPWNALLEALLARHPVPELWSPLAKTTVESWLRYRIVSKQDNLHIFIDGLENQRFFDESLVGERMAILGELKGRLFATHRGTNISSELYRQLWDNTTIAEIAPPDSTQQDKLSKKWEAITKTKFPNRARMGRFLTLIPSSPQLLNLTWLVWAGLDKQYHLDTPGKVFENILLKIFKNVTAGSCDFDPEGLLEIASDLAWNLFSTHNGLPTFARCEVDYALAASYSANKDAIQVVRETLVKSGVLTESKHTSIGHRYRFQHTSFAEFLVARHLVNRMTRVTESQTVYVKDKRVRIITLLEAKLFDPNWQQIFVFMAGTEEGATQLFKALNKIDRKPGEWVNLKFNTNQFTGLQTDDTLRHGWSLICQCYAAAPEKFQSAHVTIGKCLVIEMRSYLNELIRDNHSRLFPNLRIAIVSLLASNQGDFVAECLASLFDDPSAHPCFKGEILLILKMLRHPLGKNIVKGIVKFSRTASPEQQVATLMMLDAVLDGTGGAVMLDRVKNWLADVSQTTDFRIYALLMLVDYHWRSGKSIEEIGARIRIFADSDRFLYILALLLSISTRDQNFPQKQDFVIIRKLLGVTGFSKLLPFEQFVCLLVLHDESGEEAFEAFNSVCQTASEKERIPAGKLASWCLRNGQYLQDSDVGNFILLSSSLALALLSNLELPQVQREQLRLTLISTMNDTSRSLSDRILAAASLAANSDADFSTAPMDHHVNRFQSIDVKIPAVNYLILDFLQSLIKKQPLSKPDLVNVASIFSIVIDKSDILTFTLGLLIGNDQQREIGSMLYTQSLAPLGWRMHFYFGGIRGVRIFHIPKLTQIACKYLTLLGCKTSTYIDPTDRPFTLFALVLNRPDDNFWPPKSKGKGIVRLSAHGLVVSLMYLLILQLALISSIVLLGKLIG